MSVRILLGVALALVVHPAVAVGQALSGYAGTGFSGSDTRAAAGRLARQRGWDFAAGLSVAGTVVAPGFLTYSGSLGYGHSAAAAGGASSKMDAWTYGAGVSALGAFPVRLDATASRATTAFASEGSAGTGDTRTTGLSVGSSVRLPDLPPVDLSLARTQLVNDFFGTETEATTTRFSAATRQSLRLLSYGLAYATTANGGTFAETNYRQHDFSADVSVPLGEGVSGTLADRYHLRVPTVDAPTNPRLDDHALTATVRWDAARLTPAVQYSYRKSLAGTATAAESEVLSHALQGSLSYRRSPDLTWNGQATLTAASARSGPTEERALAQSVGGGPQWAHDYGRYRLQANGALSLDVLEPGSGPAELGYGVSGGTGASTTLAGWAGSVSYGAGYGSASGRLAGSSFSQSLGLTASGAPWQRGSLSVSLTGSSARNESPLLGTTLTRSLSLQSTARWRDLAARAAAGLSEGVAAPLRDAGLTDGLFLASGLNTSSRYATLSLLVPAAVRGLTLTAILSYSDSTAPGRDRVWEEGASLTLGYALGAFNLSANDRLVRGAAGPRSHTGHAFMVRLTRSFGGRGP